MNEPDELFILKNYFWIGNYQAAIEEGKLLTNLSPSIRDTRDIYMYRSLLALGETKGVIEAIPDNGTTPIALGAIKLLAAYLTKKVDSEMIFLTLTEWLTDPNTMSNPYLTLIAGQIYGMESKYTEAFSVLKNNPTSLEHLNLLASLYLKMDRLDLAEKVLIDMQKIEDDATLTQLTAAWIYNIQGNEKANEASLIYKELSQRFGSTDQLLNGMAASYLNMKNFEEAEKYLMEAAEKDPNNPETLINLISTCLHLHKNELTIQQYMQQLSQVAPNHFWLQDYVKLSNDFEQAVEKYSQK